MHERLKKSGVGHFKDADIEFALNAPYAKGDPEKAYEVLLLLEESEEGIVKDYNPNIKMLGAVNRNNVSCYLDATLFAMFAKLDSFEGILYNTFEDEPRKKLATLMRLWVNTLRVGRLVTIDIVRGPWLNVGPANVDDYADKATTRSHCSLRLGRCCRRWPARCVRGLCIHHRDPTTTNVDTQNGHFSHGQGRGRFRSQICTGTPTCRRHSR